MKKIIKNFNKFYVLQNKKGYVLLTSIMMLSLLTIIGLSATNIANIDQQIAGAEKNRQQAFYAAEAGIEHIRSKLSLEYSFHNKQAILLGELGDWDFALDGTEKNAATDEEGDDDGIADFKGGAVWACKSSLTDNIKYTVTVWNNDDELHIEANEAENPSDDAITDDEDGIIFVRSDGFGSSNSRAAIQIALQRGAEVTTYSIQGYDAQAGGGQEKTNSNPNDVGTVSNTQQL